MLKFFITYIYISLSINALAGESRIKDIVDIEGIRDNILVGYGLVVGLSGTGDNLNNSTFTQKGLIDFLERLGINTKGSNIKTKNIAAVTVTANLPPFARQGSRINVSVNTLGDAKSLQGGTLLATPLLGADGEVYAVAQGALSLSSFTPMDRTSTTTSKAVLTAATISSGAIIEKEINFDLASMSKIRLALHNPDVTTSKLIASTINEMLQKQDLAVAIDPGTVELYIERSDTRSPLDLLASIEQYTILPDQSAKIIIDQSSGTIVMGGAVRISPVAISQGNLSLKVEAKTNNPTSFNFAQLSNTPAKAQRGDKMAIIKDHHSIDELVEGINALGVGPRDLIAILENIKAAGALQAEIEVR